MPNTPRIPRPSHHKASGQAVVRLQGKDHYLGRYGTAAARSNYERLIGEWLSAGRMQPEAAAGMTVIRNDFVELSIRVRDLGATSTKDRLGENVRKNLEDWKRAFHSYWRWESFYTENEELRTQHGLVEDYKSLQEEACRRLLQPVFHILSQLWVTVTSGLGERAQQVMAFGYYVDQGLRPADVYKYLNTSKRVQDQSSPEITDPFETGCCDREPDVNHLAERNIIPGEVPPADGWSLDLEKRWIELGLPESLLSGIIGSIPKLQSHIRELDQTLMTGIVQEIDQITRSELAGLPTVEKQRIAPANRTRVMTLKEAARLMGYSGSKAHQRLRRAIEDGDVPFERFGRQAYIFDKNSFPIEVWPKLS
jgi:hypothetical protein